MKRSSSVVALALALVLCGCGEGGGGTLCEVLLPLVAIEVPQGDQGFADYCIECTVSGETYLVIRSSYDGIEAVPADSGLQDGCGILTLTVGAAVPPGAYLYQLSPYLVGESHGDEPGDSEGDATLTLTVPDGE